MNQIDRVLASEKITAISVNIQNKLYKSRKRVCQVNINISYLEEKRDLLVFVFMVLGFYVILLWFVITSFLVLTF